MDRDIEYKVREREKEPDKQTDPLEEAENLEEALQSFEGKIPLAISIPLGIQHLLAMFFGNMVPVAMIASVAVVSGQPFGVEEKLLIAQAALLMGGIGTLLQCLNFCKIGARMPIVMGSSFAFVYAAMTIAKRDYAVFEGACIVSAILAIILGVTAKYWLKYVPPLVSACVVVTIGLSLTGSAINQLSRGANGLPATWSQLGVSFVALATCILVNRFSRGTWKDFYLMAGLLAGVATAAVLHITGVETLFNNTNVRMAWEAAGQFYAPAVLPFVPKFELGAILAVSAIVIVSVAEQMGNVSLVSFAAMERQPKHEELGGSISACGVANLIGASLFGAIPATSYSQNCSLVATTRVVNRSVMFVVAALLIVFSFFPSFDAILYLLPFCVVGGCTVMMFGAIIVVGLELLYNCGINKRSVLIALVSLGCGILTSYLYVFMPNLPNGFRCFFDGNPVGGVFIISMILCHALPKDFLKSDGDEL